MAFTVNDTLPALTGTCTSSSGAVDGTTAAAVAHVARPDATVVSRTVTVSSTGAWSLTWAAGDLNTAGIYRVEIQLTFPGGAVQTFGPQSFVVGPEIA